jgi:pimeloyl-ACP methyl ester carboxylesterase
MMRPSRVMNNRRPPPPPPQLDHLGEVKAPTLVMVGGLDAPHMLQAGEAAARGIPGAVKIVYPGAGHMINMEQPERFNRDLEGFLLKVGGRTRGEAGRHRRSFTSAPSSWLR